MKPLFIFILTLLFNKTFSQGLIINEISNGTSGLKEFIEFLVVGSSAQSTGLVDISHWVFDDNNGDFDASTGTGVAAGHYRFTNLTPLIPIGSIIVVYNSNDVNNNMISDDPLDSNNDLVYVFPINSIYLERCTTTPSSTGGPSYIPCTYTSTLAQSWGSIGMRNSGDAIQVRKPDYSFYHGFSYGDVTITYPSFPTEFGIRPSFNVASGSGSSKNYYLDCGDWTEKTNYVRGDANFDTPGLPNNGNNLNLITNIKLDVFDYNNLNQPSNCFATILNENSINFVANKINKKIELKWDTLEEIKYYTLQKSSNGFDFEDIYHGSKNYYVDNMSLHNYYRLKLTDFSDDYVYTKIIYVEGNISPNIAVYTVLNDDYIKVETNLENIDCYIYSMSGQVISSEKLTNNLININDLPRGIYYLRLESDEVFHILKFKKM